MDEIIENFGELSILIFSCTFTIRSTITLCNCTTTFHSNTQKILKNFCRTATKKIMKFCIDSWKTHENNKKYVSVTIMKNKREKILMKQKKVNLKRNIPNERFHNRFQRLSRTKANWNKSYINKRTHSENEFNI